MLMEDQRDLHGDYAKNLWKYGVFGKKKVSRGHPNLVPKCVYVCEWLFLVFGPLLTNG